MNGRNVGMIQGGKNLGFSLEPRHPSRIVGKTVRQDFDRDVAFELGVAGTIDLTHAARTDHGADFVMAEFGSWFESHASSLDFTSAQSSEETMRGTGLIESMNV
jgi:hypothetical protein